ncbi:MULTISPECIES: hypothetical protein [Pseudomonas]|uniref:Lipoprotein n=1 Tax=Pseudomonas aphyarum TaxID=2942629 RepID=A0ABT5PSJ4_9PSED|nr:hypothetical protein [Pseudomonas aphyarum]MDD0967400.1 hypothetical protein [Pseudomonas aphyarum]MDD1126694.1 hypothetical protein [Pseudomonas aphyarum]
MLPPTRLFIALSFFAITAQAQPACVTKKHDDQSLSRCKPWPAFKEQVIALKSTYVPDAGNDDAGVFDLDLAVLNSTNARPIATYTKPGAYNSDAIRFDDLVIDTARYRLAPDVRAFGLRSKFEHSSRANPYEKTDLALYVREGGKLRPVLEGLVVYKNHGEWMDECEGEGQQIRRTVEIGPSSHNGYSDLIVTSSGTAMKTVKAGKECVSQDSPLKKTQITLTYDGKQYTIPEDLRGY